MPLPPLTDTLDRLAEGLRIVSDGGREDESGKRLRLRLDPSPAALTAAQPVALPTTLNAQGDPVGAVTALSGDLPVPVELPVSVEIEWSVRETAQPDSATISEEAVSIENGLTSPELSLLFTPQLKEPGAVAAERIPRPIPAFVHAAVTLSTRDVLAEGGADLDTSSRRVDLPPVPVVIPVLPLPTVLILFRHPNFALRLGDQDGAALVVLPHGFPLGALQDLQDILETIRSLTPSAGSLAPHLSRLLVGLRRLEAALALQPHILTVAAPAAATDAPAPRGAFGLPQLNKLTVIQNSPVVNDIEVSREMSSMIFLGPAGSKVECFTEFNFGGGKLEAETDAGGIVLIRDLHFTAPRSETGGRVTASDAPSRGFGNMIRSLKITPNALDEGTPLFERRQQTSAPLPKPRRPRG
jgi:hypothetical protein